MSAPSCQPLLSRRTGLAALVWLGACALRPAWARDATPALPLSRSLPDELQAALAQGQPLLVLINLKGCPWCAQVRDHYLAPMHADDALPVVQVNMADARETEDFFGQATTHAKLVQQWDIAVAPTVLFFGADGREVAPRLEGMSVDFYAAQLDSRLRRARKALTAPSR